jgi:hypothetical protein
MAEAAAPPPPYGLPPWAPGAAPPVPGPVFSDAFKALLVLCGEPFLHAQRTILALPQPDKPSLDLCDAVFGCVFLCLNLRESVKKLYESDIGTDNELLTRGDPGNAAWLKSVQRSHGRHSGHHSSSTPPLPAAKAAKKKGKGKNVASVADDDEEAQEMEALQPSARKKAPRPKR